MHNLLTIETFYENGKITLPADLALNPKGRVIVTFLEDNAIVNTEEVRASDIVMMQSNTGFAKEILNDPAEDVWNDL